MKEIAKDLKFYFLVLEDCIRDRGSLDMKTISLVLGCALFCILADIVTTLMTGFRFINDLGLVVGLIIYIKVFLRPQRKEYENLLEITEKEKNNENKK
tara:strand:+ start:940 stop:1233 length:294 start_codon:yes stop_codon:yes gene_type:complete